ncbi:hypothetical protein E4P82_20460 [Candidatus Competibacter phosphatis]|uniref:Uncharacterized protein n=1 Tax=Candidatus Competibacter phosphatis TaxID=221280 RepID=A0ABX1TSN5_9GAMM|nr:hypothetical protein [Candidatus Competibacter phosphatis]
MDGFSPIRQRRPRHRAGDSGNQLIGGQLLQQRRQDLGIADERGAQFRGDASPKKSDSAH